MKPWRRDLRRLLAIFHSPKRTFAEIGETPSVAVAVLPMLLIFSVASAADVIATGSSDPGSGETWALLLLPLVAVGWPFVASALYLFVFDLFGAEVRYRVILSVTLHAMWAFLALGTLVELAGWLVAGGASFGVREFLISSAGVEERLAQDLARVLNPLEIGRLVLTALGFAIAQRIARWMSFAVVFAGWLGFHALPLLQFLLF